MLLRLYFTIYFYFSRSVYNRGDIFLLYYIIVIIIIDNDNNIFVFDLKLPELKKNGEFFKIPG